MSEINKPRLRGFVVGCFHEDWRLEASTYLAAVNRFVALEPAAAVAEVRAELESLLALEISEAELRDLVLEQWGVSFDPAAEALTMRAWLGEILGTLRA